MKHTFFAAEEILAASEIEKDDFAGRRLFLYGAGAIGGAVAERLRLLGIIPTAFIDDNPAAIDTEKNGVPVRASNVLEEEGPESVAVIAVGSHAPVKLMERCREKYSCSFLYLGDFLRRLGMVGEMERINKNTEAGKALDVWADDASRERYRKLVRYRTSFAIDDLPEYSPDQYFNESLIRPEHLNAFVDAGAYDGDTLRSFLQKTQGKFTAYYALEPLPEAYEKLAETAGNDPRIHKYPVALSNESGTVAFNHVMAAGAKITRGENAVGDAFEVRAEPLDSLLGDLPVSMIKMDIEGEELRALEGAKRIIDGRKPALAICTYHLPEHLWQIPLWIAGLGMGYKIYCLHHGPYHTESVCYAV